jgi:hypothetical protein
MLFISSEELEVIPAKAGIECVRCKERVASWRMEPVDGGEKVPFCGWCVLYGGSKWGYENREDLAWAGRYVQGEGIARQGKNTIIPMLDERHRLAPPDAEKYVMGIIFTSRILENSPLGRFTRKRARAREKRDGE